MSDAVLVDAAHLAELDAMLGRTTTDTLVAPMLAELVAQPAAIRDLIDRSEIAAARSAAHGLRGAALGLGCVGVAELCGRIEHDAREDLPRRAADLLSAAERTATTLRTR